MFEAFTRLATLAGGERALARFVGGVRVDRRPEDATTEAEVRRLFALQKHARVGDRTPGA